ncbi:MAG: metal-dependent transcriptional regulator [Corynebacterium sp.]|nr:metal-dependent transcriptional regulator [Corynebacterium sp.]
MKLNDLPVRTQDYLKVVWDLQERNGHREVAVGEIAERMGQKMSTTSEAIKKLSAQGLIDRQPYSGVTLSVPGRQLALEMARRHRLLETFLVTSLGYTWDEVHEEADALEHACSEKMIDRLDALLGFPDRDPHGDPIPRKDGRVADLGTFTLADVLPGHHVTVERFCDEDSELLRTMAAQEVGVGTSLHVTSNKDGEISASTTTQTVVLPRTAARAITVRMT